MRTMALLLLVAAMPALSQIRSDQALAPVVVGAAPPSQYAVRVASDGTNFFAVWKTRTTPTTLVLCAGRLSPAGELLDRPSTLLAAGNIETFGDPDVVFVGDSFLIAYQSGSSIVTRRFSRDGRLFGQPVVIGSAGMIAWLATNGRTVFLATAPNRFRLLAQDGTQLGPERSIPNAGLEALSVASNGDRYLVAYPKAEGSPHGVVVLLTGAGDYVAAHPLPFGAPPYRRAVTTASNGSSFLVAAASDGPVSCIAVDADGQLGAAQTLENDDDNAVDATWSGSAYTLVWVRRIYPSGSAPKEETVVGARIDALGVPIDTTPIVIASLASGHSASVFGSASNGQDTILITADDYMDLRTTAAIFSSLPQIDAEPASRRHAAIASSAIEQASGSIASNGTLSLVCWRERSALDRAVVRAAFIAADGQIGVPIELGESDFLTPTATTSNGRDFFVAYIDTRSRLIARRVTLEGVIDTTPLLLTDFGFVVKAIAIGWSGQAYVIATTGETNVAILGVAPNGTVTVPRQLIDTPAPADSPAVACSTNGCSATWHWVTPFCGFPNCFGVENDLLARTDAIGYVVSQVSLTAYFQVTPALSLPAADGRFLFIYSNGTSMFAGRISSGGVVLDSPGLNGGRPVMTSETTFALQPLAIVNSGLYFVEPFDNANGHLFWARIEPEPSPRVTSLVSLHQIVTLPVTLTASARDTYFLYSSGEDDVNLLAPRLYLRTLASPDPQPSPVRKHAAR